MDIRVKIKNKNSEVRTRSNDSSAVMRLLQPTSTIYTATNYAKGWYYLKECVGWVKVSDILVMQIIEDIDFDDFNQGSSDIDQPTPETEYDGDDIIDAINNDTSSKKYIDASKIACIIGNEQVNLQTLMAAYNSSLDDMQNAVRKIEDMPEIPKFVDSDENKALMIRTVTENKETSIKAQWSEIEHTDVHNIPVTVLKSDW